MLPELSADSPTASTKSSKTDHAGRSLRIPELDGIRGIAILMVIVAHYVGLNPPNIPGVFYYAVLVPVYSAGTGVDLFFVLSGFLIGGILLDNRETINYFKVFYIRRFYRIIPIYAAWIVVFGFFALVISRFISLPADLIEMNIPFWTYLTFTQNIAMALTNSFGGPEWLSITWSLAVEEQFYLTLPIFLYLVPKKRLPVILSGLIVGVVILRRLHLAIFWKGLATYLLMPYRADALLLGVLCAWMLRDEAVRSFLVRHSRWLYIPLIGFAAWAYYLAVEHPGDVTHPSMMVYGFTIFALMYTFVLLIAVTEPRGPIKFITRLKPLRFFGLLAYGVYLFHQAINVLMHHFILGAERGFNTPERIAVTLGAFAVTTLLAYLSWIYFEKPLVGLGHQHRYIERSVAPIEAAPVLAEPEAPRL